VTRTNKLGTVVAAILISGLLLLAPGVGEDGAAAVKDNDLRTRLEKLEKLCEADRATISRQSKLIKGLEDDLTKTKMDAATATAKAKSDVLMYIKTNNIRVAWMSKELGATNRDGTGDFEVDFAPEVPEVTTCVIRGIALSRAEHDVSKFFAHVQEVQISGTKVIGKYRVNLADNDWNQSGGSMSIDVFARLKARE